jgi:hypothetical protein
MAWGDRASPAAVRYRLSSAPGWGLKLEVRGADFESREEARAMECCKHCRRTPEERPERPDPIHVCPVCELEWPLEDRAAPLIRGPLTYPDES